MTSIAARLSTDWAARSRQERLALRILLPVFGTVVVLATIPFVLAVIESLTREDQGFVGLDNYVRALSNPQPLRVAPSDGDLRR